MENLFGERNKNIESQPLEKENIGNYYIERMDGSRRTLEDMILQLKTEMNISERGVFFNTYLFGDKSIIENTLKYMRSTLDIREDAIILLDVMKEADGHPQFLANILEGEFSNKISANHNKRIMLITKGFDAVFKLLYEDILSGSQWVRFGHDWDQDVCENDKLRKMFFEENKKQVLVVNCVDTSEMNLEFRDNLVTTASSSQFQNLVIRDLKK